LVADLQMTEIIIPTPCGSIRCGQGEEAEWGGYLRLCDPDGNEIMLWNSHEWEEDPEMVIGAIFNSATKPHEELIEAWGRTHVEDGCWVS
jgi:hypothetical protein